MSSSETTQQLAKHGAHSPKFRVLLAQQESKKGYKGYTRLPSSDSDEILLEIDLGYFDPPLTEDRFFHLTDTWFQGGNSALFAGYAVLYGLRYVYEAAVPLQAIRMYFYAWNYFDFIARTFMHINNIIEIMRSRRDRKRKLFFECLDMFATLSMGAGTTLTLLSNLGMLSGTLAVASAPLASLSPAFCALMMGFIELVKCYKACRNNNMTILLRDRLKKYARTTDTLAEEDLNEHRKMALDEERGAMLAQAIAVARVAYENGKINKEAIEALLRQINEGLKKEDQVSVDTLTAKPNQIQRDLVDFIKKENTSQVRRHAFNAAFWLLVGTGLALATAATFFCPILLVPAVAVIGAAVVVKSMELTEADKRIYNCFVSKGNHQTIENDNPLINFLARRQKEDLVIKDYKLLSNDPLKNVPSINLKGSALSDEMRVKMHMAYNLFRREWDRQGINEGQFYKHILGLNWFRRRTILNRAMEKHIESEALTDSKFGTNKIASGLMQADKDYSVAKWCRKDYRLFGAAPAPESKVNPLAVAVVRAAKTA